MAVKKRIPPAARPKIGAKVRKKKSPRKNKQSRPVITKTAKPCTTTTNNIFFIIPSTFYRLLYHKGEEWERKFLSFEEQQRIQTWCKGKPPEFDFQLFFICIKIALFHSSSKVTILDFSLVPISHVVLNVREFVG